MSCIVGTAKMSGAGTSRRTIRSPATRHALARRRCCLGEGIVPSRRAARELEIHVNKLTIASALATLAIAPAPAAPPPMPPVPGSYHCVFFAGGLLQTVPGFTLTPGGYRHQNGGGGKIRLAGNVIEFVGGPLNGQAGKVEPRIIRLFNEKRTRTVIDCDTKK